MDRGTIPLLDTDLGILLGPAYTWFMDATRYTGKGDTTTLTLEYKYSARDPSIHPSSFS